MGWKAERLGGTSNENIQCICLPFFLQSEQEVHWLQKIICRKIMKKIDFYVPYNLIFVFIKLFIFLQKNSRSKSQATVAKWPSSWSGSCSGKKKKRRERRRNARNKPRHKPQSIQLRLFKYDACNNFTNTSNFLPIYLYSWTCDDRLLPDMAGGLS